MEGGEGDLFAEAVEKNGEISVSPMGETAEAAENELASFSWMARLDFIYAWMSELPVERDILVFATRVVRAGRAAKAEGQDREGIRRAAETAGADRGDHSVRSTLVASQKAQREVHRLTGLLRFSEEVDGRLVARCACDHAVLPALAEHFSARFGERRWAIVDERRRIALVRDPPMAPRLMDSSAAFPLTDAEHPSKPANDEWEDLWRNYHRAVAIDSRANPGLQRRLMPARYWKYLTELQ
jgi:probable DNA metabolism protein